MKFTVVFLILTLMTQPAFAYLDPGSGSAIISLIIGFFVSIGVLAKTFWYKIKKIIGLSKPNKNKEWNIIIKSMQASQNKLGL